MAKKLTPSTPSTSTESWKVFRETSISCKQTIHSSPVSTLVLRPIEAADGWPSWPLLQHDSASRNFAMAWDVDCNWLLFWCGVISLKGHDAFMLHDQCVNIKRHFWWACCQTNCSLCSVQFSSKSEALDNTCQWLHEWVLCHFISGEIVPPCSASSCSEFHQSSLIPYTTNNNM